MTPASNPVTSSNAMLVRPAVAATAVLAALAAVAAFVPSACANAELAAPADASSAAVSAAEAKLAVDGDLSDLSAYVEALRAAGSSDAIAEQDAAGDVRVFDASIVPAHAVAHDRDLRAHVVAGLVVGLGLPAPVDALIARLDPDHAGAFV